jgi:hypothetical protein
MSIQITYDNFTFSDPIPFVSRNQEVINYADRFGQITKIVLQGQITGTCPNDFGQLITGQNKLISGFSRDFKKLNIVEDGKNLFNADACIVRSINFDQSKYVKLLNYSIELDCYESGLFSGVYGIMDPTNEYTFTEGEDKSVAISHTVSAKGINTSTNSAINNARNYVYSLTGYDPTVLPINISNTNYTPLLLSFSENLNRLNGTYSVQESYKVDISNDSYVNASYFTRYTTTINQSINTDFDDISVQGTIQGAKRSNFNNLVNYAKALDLYGICTGKFGAPLNTKPVTMSFQEDREARTVSFSASYNTDVIQGDYPTSAAPYLDLTVDFNKDEITSITSLTVSGPIITKGNLRERYEAALQYVQDIINDWSTVQNYLYYFANARYNSLKNTLGIGSNIILNSAWRSFNITKNPEKGEITLSATFDDKDYIANAITLAAGFTKSNSFEISYEPKIDLFKPRPTYNINGFYIVYELGDAKKLATVNINSTSEFVSDSPTDGAKSDTRDTLNRLKTIYANQSYILMNESYNFDQVKEGYTKSSTSTLAYSIQNSSRDTSPVFLPAKILL